MAQSTTALTSTGIGNYDPDSLARLKSLVLDPLPSPESRRAYSTALDAFFAWVTSQPHPPGPGFTKRTVSAYKAHLLARELSPSTVNLALSAIRKLALEAADNQLLDPDTAAAISRVPGVRSLGRRTGLWLDKQQTESLLSAPDVYRVKGVRDRAILAVLIGCGLRRGEVCRLRVEQVQMRDARWVIVDLKGKGNRLRVVPMPGWTKLAIDAWVATLMVETWIGDVEPRDSPPPYPGFLFRPINKGGKPVRDCLTPAGVYDIIRHYGAVIGIPDLAPHDLRRTMAKLSKKGGAAMDQIQLFLGHSSIVTTEKYLGTEQDLVDAPCDHLGLKVDMGTGKKHQ